MPRLVVAATVQCMVINVMAPIEMVIVAMRIAVAAHPVAVKAQVLPKNKHSHHQGQGTLSGIERCLRDVSRFSVEHSSSVV